MHRMATFDLDGDGAPDAVAFVQDLDDTADGPLPDYPTALFLYDPNARGWVLQTISDP